MNPLNPWVALTEIVFLLAGAVGLGWGVAWLQYHRRIETQQRAIQQAEKEVNRYNRADYN